MKCGTTALSRIVQRYPNVVRTKQPEQHYFDNQFRKRLNHLVLLRRQQDAAGVNAATAAVTAADAWRMSDEEACRMRRDYLASSFDAERINEVARRSSDNQTNSVFAYDKTPNYVRVPGLAGVVRRMFYKNDLRIVVLLRNPVDRLQSEYLMRAAGRNRKSLPKTLDDFVQRDFLALRAANLTRAPSLEEYSRRQQVGGATATTSDQRRTASFELWEDLKFDDRIDRTISNGTFGPNSVYTGMYADQMEEWLQYFELGKDLMAVQFEKLQTNQSGEVFRRIFEFLGLPPPEFGDNVYGARHSGLHVTNDPSKLLSNATKEFLSRFYKPYNDRLADILGEEWRGVWDYL